MTCIIVHGAYGRTYKSGKAMRADWNDGVVFQDVQTGHYIAKDEAERFQSAFGVTVRGRFNDDCGICQLTK